MVHNAIIATIDCADQHADAFEEIFGQGVATMVEDRLVQRHMPFERVRAQAVSQQDVIDRASGPGDAGVERA